MKRIGSLLLVIVMFTCLLAGCSTTNDTATQETSTEKTEAPVVDDGAAVAATRDTLNYATDQEPATMDPQNMSDGASYALTSNIYEGLVWINDDGEIEPLLAKSWTISDDGLTYTFALEENVYFQNGEKFTAEDCRYTYERAIASSYTTAATSFIDSVEVIDDNTFAVTLQYPYAAALSCFGSQFLRIVNQKAVEAAGDAFTYAPGLAGTGPYILESWNSGESMTFVANENYWRDVAPIKTVKVIFISDSSTRTIALETGEVDLCKVPFLSADEIESYDNLSYEIVAGQTVNYIGFNVNTAPFDQVEVRQAIAYCCDKEEMLLVSRGSLLGGTLTATPVKESGFGFNDTLQLYPQNLEKAKELLTEAGYADGFECTIYVPNNDMRIALATYMQAYMSELNITLNIEIMEQAALLEEIKAGHTEMFIMGANAFAADADLYLYSMYHTNGSVNYVHVSDEWLDAKLDEARACINETERKALYKEITQYIYDNVYDIPNFWLNDMFAHDADLVIGVAPVASRHYFYGMYWQA